LLGHTQKVQVTARDFTLTAEMIRATPVGAEPKRERQWIWIACKRPCLGYDLRVSKPRAKGALVEPKHQPRR
jgi:hypothetical protein